jgi:hypothetical protein
MNQYTNKKLFAWKEHHAQFECDHEKKAIRKLTISGGSTQYVYQCLRCGERKNQAISKTQAHEACGGSDPQPFDEALRADWEQRRTTSAGNVNEKFNRDAFFNDYKDYLNSRGWSNRRKLVFARASGTCEGCGINSPTQVHHLTYAHVGCEFLFELVAVCDACHTRLHEDETD